MLQAQASRKAVEDRGMAGCAASLAIADRLTIITDRRASAFCVGGSDAAGSRGAGCAGSGMGGGGGGGASGVATSSDAGGSAGTGIQSLPQRAHRTFLPTVIRESGTS
jgi:hypothetical protein